MPPISSDSEDELPERGRKSVQEDETPVGSGEENEDDDDEDEVAEDEYIVEKIKAHKFEKGKLMLLVKWKGYENPADETWEPEANCSGAKEVVSEYFDSIGGRPKAGGTKRKGVSMTPSAAESKKKRGRTSVPVEIEEPTISPSGSRTSRRDTKDTKEWKPSAAVDWEKEVESIDTIEKNTGGLVCYIHWKNGHKSQHPISTAYQKCPQKMLKFYEQHLVFKENGLDMSAYSNEYSD